MKKLLLLILSLSLAACEEQSKDSESESSGVEKQRASSSSYPVNKAFQNIYTTKDKYNAGYGNKLDINPASDEIYKGKTYKVTKSTSSNSRYGTGLSNGSTKTLFTVNPFQFIASIKDKAGNYTEVTTLTTIPQYAEIGDFGAAHVANIYENNTVVGRSFTTWELKNSNETNAFLCQLINENYYYKAEDITYKSKEITEETCFEIDKKGEPTGKFTLITSMSGWPNSQREL